MPMPFVGNSQEAVALSLFAAIVEGRQKSDVADKDEMLEEAWILQTYSRCLRTVRRAGYDAEDDGAGPFRRVIEDER